VSTTGGAYESTTRKWIDRLIQAVRAVADADPEQIEATARRLGASRRYLAPVAWIAGMLVLVVRGLKLLVLNYRLLLLELVPAAWVWLTMWDLHRQKLHNVPLADASLGELLVTVGVSTMAGVAALWCNSVFGFAITYQPPEVKRAIQQTMPFRRRIIPAGILMGVVVTLGFAMIPQLKPEWVYYGFLGAMYGIMLTALVVLPAWVIGIKRTHFGPVQTVQRWVTGWALGAVAMAPGFVVARCGGLVLDVRGLEWLGYVMITLGAVLYAAGLSAVKAVTLSMKLEIPASPGRRS
jgi:hypothetical protein